MKGFTKLLLLGGLLAASAVPALADPITGSVSFSGAGTYNQSTGVFTPTPTSPNATVTFGTVSTGSLGAFQFPTGATFSAFTLSTLTSGTQLFTSTAGTTTLSFTFLPGGTTNGTPDPSGNGVILMGMLHETGYSDTMGLLDISANGSVASFTAGVNIAPTPEPSSLLLLGTGLMGAAGMIFRKRILA